MPKAPKVEVPADLTIAYPVPEDLGTAELAAMREQAEADARKLLENEKATAGDIERAEWLIATSKTLGERVQVLNDEAKALDDRRAAALGAVAPQATEGDDPEGDDDKGDADDEDEDKDGGEGAGAPAGEQQQEPVLVASSAVVQRRSAVAAARRGTGTQRPVVQPGKARAAYLTAAADGSTIDFAKLGSIAERQFGQLPQPGPSGGGGARVALPIGRVNIPSDPGLVASGMTDDIDLDKAIEWALSNERLRQETGEDSLLAAGGWCSPSETLYDLIDLTTTDGMVNVPGITVNRGGVRYSLGPDFTAVYNAGANFTRTEAQVIAALAKPIVNIPCPTMSDNRMVVDGLYLTGDILSARGWPEAYADYQRKSLTAFAHYVNAASIADMETLSGTLIDLTVSSAGVQQPNLAVSTELLGAIELQVTDMRYKNRLGLNNSVEVILPLWLKGAVRSDLAKRQGVENAANLPDSAITEFFTQRGASVQWVYDWQDAFTGVATGFGASGAAVAWPTTAKFLIHPAGTFVRALSDVIELSAVYDAQLLTTNQFVFLFMEQARLTLKRAWDARVVKVPVAVTGATGAAIDYTVAGRQPTV